MVLKRGDPINFLLTNAAALLGGVYYPITVLPEWLQLVAALLPVTYSLRAMRLALVQGHSLKALLPDVAGLLVFSAAIIPLSLMAFRYAVRRAKVNGSLVQY